MASLTTLMTSSLGSPVTLASCLTNGFVLDFINVIGYNP
jgi:hypothetical protein